MLRGLEPLPERLPFGQKLERMFADRLEVLSPDAARVLLLAALGGGAYGASRPGSRDRRGRWRRT